MEIKQFLLSFFTFEATKIALKDLLKKFENKPPEIIFQWQDSQTDAKGWVVINSLRGGAAGGGTRMRIGLDQNEVTSLAKTMEVKFTVSGPPNRRSKIWNKFRSF